METGKNSFIRVPEKYADGYYKTKAFTFSFFGGIALEGNINPSSIFNQIDYYVEVGTLATYLYYSFINKDYFNPNIWSLAIGIKANLNL
jgi:hypothetical protein